MLTGLLIKIEQSESSKTIPSICEIDFGLDRPNLLVRKNCWGHLRYFVSDEAEILVRLLLSGPPDGGFPNGIISPISIQMSSNLPKIVAHGLCGFPICLS